MCRWVSLHWFTLSPSSMVAVQLQREKWLTILHHIVHLDENKIHLQRACSTMYSRHHSPCKRHVSLEMHTEKCNINHSVLLAFSVMIMDIFLQESMWMNALVFLRSNFLERARKCTHIQERKKNACFLSKYKLKLHTKPMKWWYEILGCILCYRVW